MLAAGAACAQYGNPGGGPPGGGFPGGPSGRDAISARDDGAGGERDRRILVPSLGLNLTLTNNVNLSPSASAESDLITTITPALAVHWQGARTRLEGLLAVPVLLYARTWSENNDVRPQVNLAGHAELVDDLLFVDASVVATQQFLTPFGPTPPTLGTVTDNRYNSQTYRVSPYLRSHAAGNVDWELRNNSIWSNLGGASISTANSFLNQTLLDVRKAPEPFGVAVHAEYTEIRFSGQQPIVTELARLRVPYRVSAELELDASVGYEENRYPFSEYNGGIYGAGLRWRPNSRTSLDAYAEHRFFGLSYLASFNWRLPRSTWSAQFSRNTTSYPQQLALLGAGTLVPLVLDRLFVARIPDPAQRLEFIDQFMQERGLPVVLSSPVSIYTQQIYLLEAASVTGGWIGARNSVLVTLYRNKSEAITGAGLPVPPPAAGALDNTQLGATVVWSNQLAARVALTTTLTGYRTTANTGSSASTDQGIVTSVLSAPISPRATGYVGARYQSFRSDVAQGYQEAAIYAGFSYAFR